MLGGGRFLCKRVDSLQKVFNAKTSLRQCSNSTHSEEKIVIPKRIERGPTDILKALALTVNVDPTAFHYKFHDDPYFYPYGLADKRVFALAKESGKKSAEFVIKENPKFFQDKLAEPPIKAFEALTISIKEKDLTERGLLNAIQERSVLNAIEIYKNLKSKKIVVQNSTKQSLLELVCFFNSDEKPNLDFEEKYFEGFLGRAGGNVSNVKYWKKGKNAVQVRKKLTDVYGEGVLTVRQCQNWFAKFRSGNFDVEDAQRSGRPVEADKDAIKALVDANNHTRDRSDFAQSLYEEMDPECPLALSAIIQGMLKYMEVSSALRLFEEAVDKKMKLPVNVYNAVLERGVEVIKRPNTCGFIKKVTQEMVNQNVKPNLGTLNGALRMLSETRNVDFCIELIKEFLNFGVEPSLGSYGYLFQSISRLNSSTENFNFYKNLAHSAFNKIENEEHEILHPCDFKFFINTIQALKHNPNLMGDLPLRLHNMYLKSSNRKFVVKGADDHGFYKVLMLLLLKTQPIDVAMNFYRKHVFTLAHPESSIIKEVLLAIQENYAPEYLPEFWNDLKLLRYDGNRPILIKLLHLVHDFTDETLLKVFHGAALSYLNVTQNHWMEGDEDCFPLILLIFLKNDDEKGLEKLLQFIQDKSLCFKNLKENIVKSVFNFGLERRNSRILIGALNLAAGEEMVSVGEMVEKALPFLSGMDKAWARGLLAEVKERNKSRKPVNVDSKIPDDEV